MHVVCYGYNHETASVASREKVSFTEAALQEALHAVRQLEGIEESVILATCNRMEIYAAATPSASPDAVVATLQQWLQQRFQLGNEDLAAFYKHEIEHSVRHLFSVASGLNSMVLGETEIFGQVKKAYAVAQQAGTTGRHLNRLFQKCCHGGKQVRTQTNITRGSTSVGAVGVELAEKIFGDLKSCNILLIGAGEISRRTAQSLQSRGAKSIIVSNRSYDKATDLAEEINGKAIRFDEWHQELCRVDIVISSTSAPHHVVTPDKLLPAERQRRGRPLFMIDLSVPRDIAPEVKQLESVYVYDLDSLQQLAEAGKAKRREQLKVCYGMVDKHVTELLGAQMKQRPSKINDRPEGADPLASA